MMDTNDFVCMTLDNDRKSYDKIRELTIVVLANPSELAIDTDERIGTAIAGWIGEELTRYHADSVQALLWKQFMSMVSWNDLGRRYHDMWK